MAAKYAANARNHAVILDTANALVGEASVEQTVFVMTVRILILTPKPVINKTNKNDVAAPNLSASKTIVSAIKEEESAIKNDNAKIVRINDIVHIYYFLKLD